MANYFTLAEYYDLLGADYNSEEMAEYFMSQTLQLVGWNDHIAELADTRIEKILNPDYNGDEIVQHLRFDGEIFQQGTPVNAENLGQMEWNDLLNFTVGRYLLNRVRMMEVEIATLKGQNSNNMPYNSFVASARNINSEIEIVEGWYDEINGRGVV